MPRLALTLLLGTALSLLLMPAIPQAAQETKPASSPEAPTSAAPPAGNWKLILPLASDEPQAEPSWLVKFSQDKDNKWAGEVLATAKGWPKAKIENLSVANNKVSFTVRTPTLSLLCEAKLPKDAKSSKIYGSALLRKRHTPMELERTAVSSLDPFELAKEILERQAPGHEIVQMVLPLLRQAEAKKIPPAQIRAWAERAVKSAEMYSPAWTRDVLLAVANALSDEKGYEAIALQYAQRAERGLDEKEPATAQKRVLEILAALLEKSGKADEAKKVQARIDKLDFRIKPKTYAGRKGKSNRAVLVELFTGAQCPPCVASDLAFDALAKSYKPTEVVLLQYHLHVPGPDALTNSDTEARASFYDQAVRGTPTILFDGRPNAPGGGRREDAVDKYDEYLEVLNSMLEAEAGASVSLAATRKGDKINITAEVSKLNEAGDDVRLRLALVEDEVKYKGTNGLDVHHYVVRAMPGGAEGTVLKEKTPTKKTFTVDLEELRKKLKAYLDKSGEKKPFPNKEQPLELKKLRVVAFVQNDRTGEVLQSAQVDVKGE